MDDLGIAATRDEDEFQMTGNEAQARIAMLEKALKRIERWFDQFPPTGRFWDEPKNTDPMSYAACWGSNGERDFMRTIARNALDGIPDEDANTPAVRRLTIL